MGPYAIPKTMHLKPVRIHAVHGTCNVRLRQVANLKCKSNFKTTF